MSARGARATVVVDQIQDNSGDTWMNFEQRYGVLECHVFPYKYVARLYNFEGHLKFVVVSDAVDRAGEYNPGEQWELVGEWRVE